MSFESPKKRGVETRSCPKCGVTTTIARRTNCLECGTLLPLVNMPPEKEVGKAEILENTEIGRLDRELAEQYRLLRETSKGRFLKRKKIENKIKEINENIIRTRGEMRSNKEQEGKTGEAPKKESSIWLNPIDVQKEGEQEINLLKNINIESNISYQEENYIVKETPSEENKNKYVLEHSRGKPIYKLTAEQLSKALESGEAKLVLPVEENKEDIARLRELDELKVEEAELREAIENLRKQILALPDDEPAEKAPKQIEKEIKTFSTEYIKSKILPLLENFVSEVKNLEIKGVGEEIILNTTVVKYNFNIGVEATLQNEENGIGVKSHKINASFMAKGKAEREIAPQLNKVSDLLREYIEKEENRKVEKIEIENGELKVTFENK